MEQYYRINFSDNNYLAWAHGEFYITHIKSFAILFTKETLNNNELNVSLKTINKAYVVEKIDNTEKIRKRFIYN